jgi:flagellar motor switch protein FliM
MDFIGTETVGAAAEGPALQERAGRFVRNVAEVKNYDFRRPHRVSKERLLALEAMYERLVKSLEGWLVGRVRTKVELSLNAVEQISFAEFTHTLATPCAAYLFRIQDSGGMKGVIDIGQEFAYFLVDRLFGGGGNPTSFNRALTPLERMAVRIVAERTMSLLIEVWHDHIPLDLEISGFESIPEILRAESRDDPMLVAHVDTMAMGVKSSMSICLPLSILEKFFSSTGQRQVNNVTGSEKERSRNRLMAESSLRSTELTVSARMPDFQLSMRELALLREGSVISTGIPCDTELSLLVSGRPRFRGAPGRVGRRLAVKVIGPMAGDTGEALTHYEQDDV